MYSFLRPNAHPVESAKRFKLTAFLKNWTLPLSILSGIVGYFIYVNIPLFDSTHRVVGQVVGFVQPLLIFMMLFLTFLNVGPRDLRLGKWHFILLVLQMLLFGGLALMLSFVEGESVRIMLESAMLCLLCPTATAAAVVTRKLDGRAADITTYTILINLSVALTAPLLLPLAHPLPNFGFVSTFALIMSKVFPLLIFPLVLAWGVRRFLPSVKEALVRYRDLPFYMWAVALAMAIAVTVKAIVHSSISPMAMFGIVIITLVCCMVQFYVGKRIGMRFGRKVECGQALGQKNTVFIIWMGYTFLSPVTAMAGGLYSVWHNIYNSWQLYCHRKN